MMNSNLTEQILKEKQMKLKRHGNRLLIGTFLLFIFGYTFFFTSNIWLPASYDNIHVTPVGGMVNGNDRKVTLLSWTYDKERRMQEVIMDINNSSTDGMDTYNWTALDRNQGNAEVEVIVEDHDFVVLHIKNLHPRWTEISLRMDAAENSGNTEFQRMKLYTSKKEVEYVSGIKTYTADGYRLLACNIRIAFYTEQMNQLLDEIAGYEEVITNAENRIKELREKQSYQTEAEKTETLAQINMIESEKAGNQGSRDTAEQEIAELEKRIELQEQLKENY